MITEQICKTAEELFPYVVESRRKLHRRPELSGKEYETAAFIVEEMKKLGLEPTWLWESVAAFFEFDTGRCGKGT